VSLLNQSRAEAYRLLAVPFLFPEVETVRHLQQGMWGERLQLHLADLMLADFVLESPVETSLRLESDFCSYESEFISLHEVGLGGAPCPLHSGHYARDRMKTLEEVVRFYHFFGYQPDRSVDRFQDHVVFELGFMVHLIEIENAPGEGTDIGSSQRAQKDFVDRNLASWLPQLSRVVEERSRLPFIKQAVRMVEWVVSQDQAYLCGRSVSC
jgi:DMSO reductase family type II enzyme chaperone